MILGDIKRKPNKMSLGPRYSHSIITSHYYTGCQHSEVGHVVSMGLFKIFEVFIE